MDEDLRLAIRLSLEESRKSQDNTRVTSEEEDYQYALKLSRELNSPSSTSDFARTKNDTSTSYVDDDYLLAVKLARDDEGDSLRETKEVGIEDDFPDDVADADFELALRFAESGSSNSLKTPLTVSEASGSSKPSFHSAMDDRDSYLAAQLYETDDSDIELHEAPPLAASAKVKRTGNRKKSSPCKTNPDTYMNTTVSVVDPSWETIDPNPDIYALFIAFNKRFFWGRLDMVEVKWSPRMTLCAGICSYSRRAGHCVVKLSKPLLTYRPRKDLVETLLHEMIHAFLFVTHNDRDRDGHGPNFHEHMYRINREGGSNITVYHSFHDEVKLYKTHVWRCDGPCVGWKPFYGLVKRSMNRAPGPNDIWWSNHAAKCGGKFHKIKEPENYGKKKGKKTNKTELTQNSNISKFLTSPKKSLSATSTTAPKTKLSSVDNSSDRSSTSTSSTTSSGLNNDSVPKSVWFVPTNTQGLPTQESALRSNGGDLFKRNAMSTVTNTKIVTLADLSKNKRKRGSTESLTKSPKKWTPLPGQKNILSFINKSS